MISSVYQIVALLCSGLYPNICYHKEKRLVLTSDGKTALLHKASVNLIHKSCSFPSPFFVFGEKVSASMLLHTARLDTVVDWLCGLLSKLIRLCNGAVCASQHPQAFSISFLPSFLLVEDQGYFCQNYNNGGTIASHDVWLFITPFVWKKLGQN